MKCPTCDKTYLECNCDRRCDMCNSANIEWYDDGDGYVDFKCINCGNWLT